jgi:hypothetical protein
MHDREICRKREKDNINLYSAQLTQQAMFRAMFEDNLLTKPAHLDRYDLKAHQAEEEQATFNCTRFRPQC